MNDPVKDNGNSEIIKDPVVARKEESLELKESHSYLIKEVKPEKVYTYFQQAVNVGINVLCITRDPPQKFTQKYNSPNCSLIWLSNMSSGQATQIKDLDKFALSLDKFMSEKAGSLILLDCIEYLVANNDFNSVLQLFQNIRDSVLLNRAILLISVNPKAFTNQQISLMEHEIDMVI